MAVELIVHQRFIFAKLLLRNFTDEEASERASSRYEWRYIFHGFIFLKRELQAHPRQVSLDAMRVREQ